MSTERFLPRNASPWPFRNRPRGSRRARETSPSTLALAGPGRMTTLRLRHALARALGPTAFYPARRMVVLFRYYGRIIYDRDLLFVRHLRPQPLLIDVGANAGQSALCMAMLRPDARIISFEANADNISDLAFVRRILGARYSYHHIGLSDRSGSALLRVPVVGRTPVSGESSFLKEFDSSIERRIGAITKIVEQEVNLETFELVRTATSIRQNRCPRARTGSRSRNGGDAFGLRARFAAREGLWLPRHPGLSDSPGISVV